MRVQGSMGSCHHLWVGGQAQVVVGAQVQHWRCCSGHPDVGALGRGNHALLLVSASRLHLLDRGLAHRGESVGHSTARSSKTQHTGGKKKITHFPSFIVI